MAHVCFTWELGQGYGHLVRYRAVIEKLLESNHAVSFIAKDAARARRVFDGMHVEVTSVMPGTTPAGERLVRLNSYPEILHDFGFNSPDQLSRQLSPWLDHFSRLQPDVLVVDHSPTALVAARIAGLPFVSAGSGFTVPPRTTPMRPLRYWTARGRERLEIHEQLVLATCNVVLGVHAARELGSLAELLAADREWLLTFPELDHYGERAGARYLGNVPAADFGASPRWRDVAGPKLFAYLSTPTVSPALVEALRVTNANLCLHAPQINAAELSRFDSERTVVELEPVNIRAVAASADAVITNGSLNTVSALLAAGVPQLALPNNLERHMVGRRLELVGGGLMAPWRDGNRLSEKLHAVINGRAYARAAEQFALRHAAFDAMQQTALMLADLETWLDP